MVDQMGQEMAVVELVLVAQKVEDNVVEQVLMELVLAGHLEEVVEVWEVVVDLWELYDFH